jgi:small subunit ribosomal protein S2
MLTNFETIRRSIDRLEQLEAFERDNVFRVMTKKEVSRLVKELAKLRRVLTGVRELKRLPDALFVVDPAEEDMAVAEARKLKIPIVAVCDTNCDPDLIDHPIPGNDDAARAIKLFCSIVADAILEGKSDYDKKKAAASVEGAEAQMAAAGDGLTIEGAEEAPAEAPAEEPAPAEAAPEPAAEAPVEETKA